MQDVHVKLNSGLARRKAAFHKKKALFTCKTELNLRRKLLKCYIWGIDVCGATIGA